jgi:oxygen-dependent protoporphyrinogen oxidase
VRETPVVIVGGGITGLSCAYTLAGRSIDFLLIEKQERLGGTIATERVDDFILDTGPDAFLIQKPDGLALCRELGLDDDLIPTNPEQRAVYVLFRGRLHPLPEGMVLTVPSRFLPLALSGLFSPLGKLRMGLELFIPARRDGQEESITSFVERRLGREVLDRLAEPLLAGIHSGDPDRLSMNELFPRFVGLEKKYGSLIRGIRKAKVPRGSGAKKTLFMSLSGGLSVLVDALVDKLPRDAIVQGAGVERIRREGSGYVVETSAGEPISCRALALCLPAKAAGRLAEGLSADLSRTLTSQTSVSTAVVFLAFPREKVAHPLAGYGFVVPRTEGKRILAATFVSTKFPNRAPGSHVLLRGFLGGARDPEVLDLSDQQMVELVRRELSEILCDLPAPSLSRVCRWTDSTPQVELGHGERTARIDSLLSQIPGLQVSANGLRGVGIPDCIADGRRVGETLAAFIDGISGTDAIDGE